MAENTQTPSDSDVLAAWVRAGIAKIHTSFPATIITYDPTTQKATVQPAVVPRVDDPLLDIERPDVPFPPVPNLSVLWPSSSQGSLTFGLLSGDPVTVLVSERSTDEFRTIGGVTNVPLDARRFDMSDGVVIPGGRSFNPAALSLAPLVVGTQVDVTGATVVGGALPVAGVKLGSAAAVQSVILGEAFLTMLDVFLADLGLSVTVADVVTAAGLFQVALAATPHTSLKVKVDL